ncbi:MAG: alpha/beta hydrolase [Bacteroidales bacterium]|nr:alpha/beta hydrolase [Bacteroidales bacterium]
MKKFLTVLATAFCFLPAGGKGLKYRSVSIDTAAGKMKVKVLQPKEADARVPGILWIHGGGYMTGGTYMVRVSCGKMLAERYGAVVVSPEYRKAGEAPYPAALEDCYAALEWMYVHADELGIDRTRIVVGGESAGGGLTAAVCLYARDKGKIPVAFQLPLYPMLDCEDTESSADNHGLFWGTVRNHRGWKLYLGDLSGTADVPSYASPARATDYANLPPCYTYVLDGEPFYTETLAYVKNLQAAGVDAKVDVYPGNTHAFDILLPWQDRSKRAKRRLCEEYERIIMKPASMRR